MRLGLCCQNGGQNRPCVETPYVGRCIGSHLCVFNKTQALPRAPHGLCVCTEVLRSNSFAARPVTSLASPLRKSCTSCSTVCCDLTSTLRGECVKLLLLSLIRAYQLLISPHLGSACRFYPTCSVYTHQALDEHGAGVGAYLGLRRIVRCNPWCDGGVDPVPKTFHWRNNA
jgi:uncharacterized protein